MKIVKRLGAIIAVAALSVGALGATATDADAKIRASRATHQAKSDRSWLVYAEGYNGKGERGSVQRGHRFSGDPTTLGSIYLPKNCDLWAQNVLWNRNWDGKPEWVNIKYPFRSVPFRLECK